MRQKILVALAINSLMLTPTNTTVKRHMPCSFYTYNVHIYNFMMLTIVVILKCNIDIGFSIVAQP